MLMTLQHAKVCNQKHDASHPANNKYILSQYLLNSLPHAIKHSDFLSALVQSWDLSFYK